MVYRVIVFLVWALASCATPSKEPAIDLVQVREGDTIAFIASKYDVSPQDIVAWNEIDPRRGLIIGQTLKIFRAPQDLQQNPGRLFGSLQDERNARLLVPVTGRLTSRFGMRRGRPHQGIDIAANSGQPIYAAEAGQVIFAGWMQGYGRTVILEHQSSQLRTLYAHCSKLETRKGASISRGQRIGAVGRSGNARGSHLHFEVQNKRGLAVDPEPYFLGSKTLLSDADAE